MPEAETASDARAALAAHDRAVARWIKAERADRAAIWREVEAAWRAVRNLRADLIASQHAAARMRTSGKLRNIA